MIGMAFRVRVRVRVSGKWHGHGGWRVHLGGEQGGSEIVGG